MINYPQVGPGIHEVAVIFEGTSGSVRIVAQARPCLKRRRDQGQRTLIVGDYQVECETAGVVRQIALSVREGLATRRRLTEISFA